tara:strand:+ start:238 stop:516 length:279 start_codon:yes stop_codon:yes gene_type:complete
MKKKYLLFLLFLLIPISGCGNSKKGLQLSDEFLSNESLQNMCDRGIQYSVWSFGGTGFWGKTLKGRVALGNMSGKDFTKMQKWFLINCPDAW